MLSFCQFTSPHHQPISTDFYSAYTFHHIPPRWVGRRYRHIIALIPPLFKGLTHVTAWWRHQMETFSALLAICAGNSPVPGEFPTQRPVTRSFDVYFDQRPDKRLSKRLWSWWFETLSHSLWRHRNGLGGFHGNTWSAKSRFDVFQTESQGGC